MVLRVARVRVEWLVRVEEEEVVEEVVEEEEEEEEEVVVRTTVGRPPWPTWT